MAQRNSYSRGAKRHSPYWKDRPRNSGQVKDERGTDGGPEAISEAFSEERPPVGDGSAPSDSRREKKYSNRARLFVGNLPKNMTEEELVDMFRPFGENPQAHIERERNFGFVRMVSQPCLLSHTCSHSLLSFSS